MQFLFKLPTETAERDKELTERGFVKSPRSRHQGLAILGSLPFMGFAYLVWWLTASYFHQDILHSSLGVFYGIVLSPVAWYIAVSAYLLTFLHELLHASMIPHFLSGPRTYFGITWFGGFISTAEEIPQNRYRLMYLMPYLVLSLIMMPLFGMLGWLNNWTTFLFFLNSLGSSVDIAGVLLIGFLIPRGATVAQNGTKVYYRPAGPPFEDDIE